MTKNKYGAKKTIFDGVIFASGKEATRYRELLLLERAGEIRNLKIQPAFQIIDPFEYQGKHVRGAVYTADFEYWEDSRHVVEEVKGGTATQTQAFKLRWKLAKSRYPWIDWRLIV